MNAELHISAGFIYNGLNQLGHIHGLANEDEIFEILYNLSVGFERLIKIGIVLAEYSTYGSQEEFEKSLITHNHQVLISRLQSSYPLTLSTHQNSLLQCLSRFYKTFRYDRYCLDSVENFHKESGEFWKFLEQSLDIQIDPELLHLGTPEMPRIRKFVGNTCRKISTQLYSLIQSACTEQQLYTDEIRNGSKASKIFQYDEGDFTNEEIVWKEVLLYLIKSGDKHSIDKFIDNLLPLEFEECDILDVIDQMGSDLSLNSIRDTVEELYESGEIPDLKDRIEQLKYLGSNLNYMDLGDDDNDS